MIYHCLISVVLVFLIYLVWTSHQRRQETFACLSPFVHGGPNRVCRVPDICESPQAKDCARDLVRDHQIKILDSTPGNYPPMLTIARGDSVEWVNFGLLKHTITSDNNLFDSGSLCAGNKYSLTFDQPGVYQYYCRLHPTCSVSTIVVN